MIIKMLFLSLIYSKPILLFLGSDFVEELDCMPNSLTAKIFIV